MINLNTEHRLDEIRRQEAMRRASKNQPAATPSSQGTGRPALARLGEVLSNIGDNLQQRYGETTETGYSFESA